MMDLGVTPTVLAMRLVGGSRAMSRLLKEHFNIEVNPGTIRVWSHKGYVPYKKNGQIQAVSKITGFTVEQLNPRRFAF